MNQKSRLTIFLMVMYFILHINLNNAYASTLPLLSSQSAILMDADTGDILFKKNELEKRQPASTTKVLTSILALEIGQLDDIVTISEKVATIGEASIDLRKGERITLENLLFGALVRSGNDACVAIGEHLAGNEKKYVDYINLKAKLIGSTDTNFINTNGLPDNNHITTAMDLANITRYALNNSKFKEIVSSKNYIIKWEESDRLLKIKNTNKLLWSYPGIIGVKTGTTDIAGKCLIAAAKREDKTLIAVVLKSNNRFSEAARLLDYGFNNFQQVNVFKKNEIIDAKLEIPIQIGIGQAVSISVPENRNFRVEYELFNPLPKRIIKGDFLGISKIIVDDQIVKKVPIQAFSDYEEISNKDNFFNNMLQVFFRKRG